MPSKLSKLYRDLGFFTPIFGIALFGYYVYHQLVLLGILAAVVSVVTSIIFFGSGKQTESKHKQTQLEFLQTFQPDRVDVQKLKSFTSYDLLAKIAIDPRNKKIYFWNPDSKENITKAFIGMPYSIKTYNFSDLLAVQFTEDSHETATVQKDTHYTNYLLNKLQEEASAVQSTYPPVDKVHSMALEVIVNDNIKPIHKIHFYYEPHRKIRKSSPEYNAIHKELKNWFSRLETIVHEPEQHFLELETEKHLAAIDSENDFYEEDFIKEKNVEIMADNEKPQPALRLPEASPVSTLSEQYVKDDSEEVQKQKAEKPTSYFDQLVEKNRRQLRGDYDE